MSIPFIQRNLIFGFDSFKLPAIGIQLYMVRDDMKKDPAGTLKKLGQMGYSQIESFGGDEGIFWGKTNKEFNGMARDNGLTLVSSHYEGNNEEFEKTAELSAAIGMKYLIYPWKGPQKSIDDFKKIADEFNGYGVICKKHGLRFAYHPHDYPYKKIDGQLPIDVLLDHTDPDLVDFEMDIYWVVTAGQDPEAWLKKHKNRFRLCHIKDRKKNTTEKDASCILGEGGIDYAKIIKTAKDNGVQYYIVEQERYDNTTEMDCAKANAEYLKKFKF